MIKKLKLTTAAFGIALVVIALAGCKPGGSPTGGNSTPTAQPTGSCPSQSTNEIHVQPDSNFVSNFASAPATGAAVVTNGIFSNLYLWPDPGRETWDQHLVSLRATANASETSENIDNITCALVSSSYFDALTQYGIAPPVFAGDVATTPTCVNAAMSNASANAGVIQWTSLVAFVSCEQSQVGGATTQVNVFFSPEIKVADLGSSTDICSQDSGYHTSFPGEWNFTVLPTNMACNGSISSLTETLSHEMVETISDPAGFGWIHETIPGRVADPTGGLATEYSVGELGDICSSVGAFSTGSIPFEDPSAGVGTLSVAPYWSDADNTCEPKFIMNQTLATEADNPLVEFTGQLHTFNVPVSTPQSSSGDLLQALEIEITTGGDDLRAGSGSGDNAGVLLNLSSGQTYAINNINESNEWANSTLHSAFLSFPPGIAVRDVSTITLATFFGGGISGDNWKVNGITVKAAVSQQQTGCPALPATLVNAQGNSTLPDGSIGLLRMTAGVHQWSTGMLPSGTNADRLVNGLQLSIGTGGDDLRGGSSPGDNADVTLSLASGYSVTFSNINQSGNWANYSSHSVQLLTLNTLPPNTTLGDITGLKVQTNFSGGSSGDNWDIASVVLQAAAGCVYTGPTQQGPINFNLVFVTGGTILSDGSVGLIRFTGSVHDWMTSITVPSNITTNSLVGLQLTITTGKDNLNGGSNPSDNVDVVIQYSSGSVTYTNVNQSQEWAGYSTHTVTLAPVPPSTTLGQIQSLTIHTAFGGGPFGDNWDVYSVILTAMEVA